MVSVPVTATGVSSRIVASRLFGTTFTHSLSAAIRRLDVGQRHVLLELEGERLAVAAHRADAHAQAVDRHGGVPKPAPWPRILLVSALPFHSSRRCRCRGPCRSTGSASRPAARRSWPFSASSSVRCFSSTRRSISRIALVGSASSVAHLGVQRAELRQQLAHVLRAAARGRLVGHACSSTRPARP